MKERVEKYIHSEEFVRQSNGIDNSPVMFCYQDFVNRNDTFFSKEEQEEIFAYFLEERSKRLLVAFSFWNKYTLAKTPSFSQIQDLIENEISDLLEGLRVSEEWTLEKCFDFLDYINSLSEIRERDVTLTDLKYIMSKLSTIIKTGFDKNEQKYMNSIFVILGYILKNASISIDDDLLGIFVDLKNKIDRKFYGNLRDFYRNMIWIQCPKDSYIDPRYKNILLFVLRGNDFSSKIYNQDLIPKIGDQNILEEIFTSYFPKIKSIYEYDKRFNIIFLVVDQLKKLKVNADTILSYLSKDQRDNFLKYLGHLYQQQMQKQLTIKISDYTSEINLNDFIPLIKSYIINLSQNQNFEFTWSNTWNWCADIFKNIINTTELYHKCSPSAKGLYHWMIQNENDPLWQEVPDEERSRVLQRNEEAKNIQNKKEERKRLRKEKENSCINDFFDKDTDFIKQESEKIKEYFGKLDVTHSDIYDYIHDTSSIVDPSEILMQNLPILNSFLICHLYDMYYILRDSNISEATVNLDDIFNKVLENWDDYWGLYLYSYLITLKKFDFPFTPDQKEKLISYFEKLQDDNTIPIYIYWHLKKVFGIAPKITEDIALKLFTMNYGYLSTDSPIPIHIYDKIYYNTRQGFLFSNIVEHEKKDFSTFIEDNNLDKLNLFNRLVSDLAIENTCFYYNHPNCPRFHLLSVINIYKLLDSTQKQEYEPTIKNFCKQHMEVSIQKADQQPYLSLLVLETINNLGMELEILELINKASVIHETHLSQVTIIQRKYFRQQQWNSYKSVLYSIRKDIELKNKEVIPYNYTKNPIRFNQEDRDNFEDLKNRLSSLKLDMAVNYEEYKKLKDTAIKVSENLQKYTIDETPHEIKYNSVYALAFLDMDEDDFDIWERFCKMALEKRDYYFQDMSIPILTYIIQNYRIKKIEKFIELIIKNYDHQPEPKEYPSGVVYTPEFEFIYVLQECIDQLTKTDFEYNSEAYDLLLRINNLTLAQREKIRLRSQKLKFVTITYSENKYWLDNKEFNSIDDLIQYYTEIKSLKADATMSQIRSFEYLIQDMKNKTWTMSHPHCFEDPIENQYPIDKPLYISCWSFSEGRNNAYAWWKLYGNSKKSFRSIIPITSLIKSAVSLLNKCPNSTLYLGSIEYNLENQECHRNSEDFFKKRSDFKFENEFRVMIDIHKDDISKVKLLEENYINKRCSFDLAEFNIYKDIDLGDTVDDPKFSPFIIDILDKDKKAMLKVIERENEWWRR